MSRMWWVFLCFSLPGGAWIVPRNADRRVADASRAPPPGPSILGADVPPASSCSVASPLSATSTSNDNEENVPSDESSVPADAYSASNDESDGSSGSDSSILRHRSKALDVEAYNLVWSPGAWKKITLTTSSLFLLRFFQNPIQRYFLVKGTWMASNFGTFWSPISSFTTHVVLPLLASACCLLQLLINLLAGGCAGFNTYLGPIRPYFLALLLFLTLSTRGTSSPWLGWTALRWTVALLPESLHCFNRYWEAKLAKSEASVTVLPLQATVQLDIPSMGCVACINTIDQSLRTAAPDRVLEAASSLNPLGAKGGQATVRLSAVSDAEVYQIVNSLVQSVQKAGFEDCQVESVNMRKIKSVEQED